MSFVSNTNLFFLTVAWLFVLKLIHIFTHNNLNIFDPILHTDFCVILKMSFLKMSVLWFYICKHRDNTYAFWNISINCFCNIFFTVYSLDNCNLSNEKWFKILHRNRMTHRQSIGIRMETNLCNLLAC